MFASIILAGGDSSRIGDNKALLELNGKTLIEIVIEKLKEVSEKIYIVTHNKSEFSFLNNVEIIEDYELKNETNNELKNIPLLNFLNTEKPRNILNAIYTGLKESEYQDNFICGCDMPYLNVELIKYLYSFKNQYDAIVPVIEGKPISLHTFYNKNSLDVMEKSINKNNKVVRKIFRDLNTKYLPEEVIKPIDKDLKSFFHIKTRLDYILTKTDY